ncbi:MAG: xanthine dehydrogenase family protein molybdopterin-binding subunit [Candidatus Caldarchaeum sp.]
MTYVGQGIKRTEDHVLVRGLGTFVDDVALPRMLYGVFLRSPHPHAKIIKIDIGGATEIPEVVLVLTGKDVVKMLPPLPLTVSHPQMRRAPCYCLAVDKVFYVGEPVAFVVAEDRYVAQDAVEAIAVEYEVLPPVVDMEKAIEPSAHILHDGWPDNIVLSTRFESGNVAAALEQSDVVVKDKVRRQRYTGSPVETRGYVADFNPGDRSITIYASVQTPHIFKSVIAQSLNLPEHKIRVVAKYVGGGFGVKIPIYQEEPLIPLASILTKRPVKWIETRTEHLMAACHSREQVHSVELGFKRDGTLLAIKDRFLVDLGAYVPQPGLASALATARFIPSGYRVSNYLVEMVCVRTNKAPFGAVRGFGKADSNYVIEHVMDKAARELGIDPIELRLKNLIRPDEFPYVSPTGSVHDSGQYGECIRRVKSIIDYDGFRARQNKLWKSGIYQGISVVFMLEPVANAVPNSLHTGYESAKIRMWPSGEVTVYAGVADQGQGHKTALAQIAADELGLTFDMVKVVEGDTEECPYGLGAWASRFSVAGVGAVATACRKLRNKLVHIAAHMLEANPADIVIEYGKLWVRDVPSKSITIRDLAQIAYTQPYRMPPDVSPSLEETATYILPNIRYIPDEKGHINLYPAYSYGAYAVIVSVDIETGAVKILDQAFVSDTGNVINPILLDGQITGGVLQGIGGGLYEEIVYNEDGYPLNTTFMDYLLPSAREAPRLVIEHLVTPSPYTVGGFKGGGEGGAIPPPVALLNAVNDALRPLSIEINEMPLTPHRVFAAIRGKVFG